MARVHKTKVPEHPFDRARHSVNGMPTCALCHHAFTHWEVLAKHIRSWSCPAMPLPPTHTSAPADTEHGLQQVIAEPPHRVSHDSSLGQEAAAKTSTLCEQTPSKPAPQSCGKVMEVSATTASCPAPDVGSSAVGTTPSMKRSVPRSAQGGVSALLRQSVCN